MATFGYEVQGMDGKIHKGSIEAESLEAARAEVKGMGGYVIKLEEQSLLTKDLDLEIGGKPTPRDLGIFCRQFTSMTKAGVSIVEAMTMLCEQTENKKLRKALEAVKTNLEKGEGLAVSMAEHPNIFPSIMVNMVAAGEASGSLDNSMERVASQMEQNAKTKALVKKAMIYPVVLLVVALAVIILMLVFVIPQYSDMFADLGTDLPAITKAAMAASDFIKNNFILIAIAIIAIVAAIAYYARTDHGQHLFGKLALKIPAIKNLTVKSASSSLARTLSTLLSAGVPMTEALEIVANTMTNVWFKEALMDAKNEVIQGVPLSQPLEASGLFPPMVYHMIRIGEESGSVESMLDKLADYYDEEVEMAVQSMMALLEPLIIIVLAVVVVFLIACILSPMMKMYEALDAM